MKQNRVFVLDHNLKPLMPCHPARARQLLRNGRAAIWRRSPFTIVLKNAHTGPGSPVSGPMGGSISSAPAEKSPPSGEGSPLGEPMHDKALQYLLCGDIWVWRDSAGNGPDFCRLEKRENGVEFHLHDAERENENVVVVSDDELAESCFVQIEGRTFLAIPFDGWQLYIASLISVSPSLQESL